MRSRLVVLLLTLLCSTIEVQIVAAVKPPKQKVKASPSTIKRNTKKKDGRQRQSATKSEINDILSDQKGGILSSRNSKSSGPLVVESILLPRQFSRRGIIRLASMAIMLLSLRKCLQTAGIPHVQTIWTLVNDGTSLGAIPIDYLPSQADIYLSQMIASATHELLPPLFLPSAGPLLGLLVSCLVYIVSTILLPRWSTTAKVFLDYKRVPVDALSKSLGKSMSSKAAVLVRIHDAILKQQVSADRNQDDRIQSSVICALEYSPSNRSGKTAGTTDERSSVISSFSHPHANFFELNQCRYYFDERTGQCLEGGPSLHSARFDELYGLLGSGLDKNKRKVARERYSPYNRPSLVSPTVQEAFVARISSPLVVVQLLGCLLSCLEEGAQAIVQAGTRLGQHYMNARQAIVAAGEMAKEIQENVQSTARIEVLALSINKNNTTERVWEKTTAGELLPGEIFCLSRETNNSSSLVLPVDALLLNGQCLTNEAVLTGESVPQSKTPLIFQELLREDENSTLDLDENRNSILFAGTTMVHATSDSQMEQIQGHPIPPHGLPSAVVCMTLRTGTYSSKGQMLRTLQGNAGHVGAISNAQSEKDAMRLISSLSVFAVLSCASLFIPHDGLKASKSVPIFRRIVQCTRIAIASIPSDLPLALSAVARSCSRQLRQDSDVVCSEAGSLLTAAYIDTVVFDKTGTLTADTQSVSKLVHSLPFDGSNVTKQMMLSHLAGSHALVHIEQDNNSTEPSSQMIGDPLDQVAFQFSGWSYNFREKCFQAPKPSNSTSTDPKRLWQIKSFPFDPNRRLSTAIVLMEYHGGNFSLLSLTKGSPETLRNVLSLSKTDDFIESFDMQMADLEGRGFRSIVLAYKDLKHSDIRLSLFPKGLSKDGVDDARRYAVDLPRKTVEDDCKDIDFGGFVCFDASIRPSSERILEELRNGGLKSIMLTGDAIDAAIAVAYQVALVQTKKVAILETDPTQQEQHSRAPSLRWRLIELKKKKGENGVEGSVSLGFEILSIQSVDRILKQVKGGKLTIAASGEALDLCFQEEHADLATREIVDNLSLVTVIARATPHLKNQVISNLKGRCGKRVLMCGDGVNDVTAMKSADVAVALLNGFGDEHDINTGIDEDNKRRKLRLQEQPLGTTKKKRSSEAAKKSNERIKKQIEDAQAAIRQRVAERTGQTVNSTDLVYDMKDMKDMISASMNAAKSEIQRSRSLKLGGPEAARILAEERRQLGQSNGTIVGTTNDEEESIKPGEASLVAPFSCLHPSIDGVDSVLRAGIATAASALATQEMIALHSLMSCYHLATLYRDGFRYGKNMWPVELAMYLLIDNARYKASCTPRPRLPHSHLLRPHLSLFSPASLISTLSQAFTHLITMALGVNYARALEIETNLKPRQTLRLMQGTHPPKLSKFLDAVASTESNGDPNTGSSLLRRQPFQPNYETNMVFLLSILQSAISSVVNHKGKPFYRSLLESRELCFASVLTAFTTVILIVESFPLLNGFIQLKPLPSDESRLTFLGIAAANLVGCILCRVMVDAFFTKKNAIPGPAPKKRNVRQLAEETEDELAPDLEERLLKEEASQNMRTIVLAFGSLTYLSLELLTKSVAK